MPERRPPESLPPEPSRPEPEDPAYTDEEEAEVRKRLEDLGYVE